jgi:hypothetical protein
VDAGADTQSGARQLCLTERAALGELHVAAEPWNRSVKIDDEGTDTRWRVLGSSGGTGDDEE